MQNDVKRKMVSWKTWWSHNSVLLQAGYLDYALGYDFSPKYNGWQDWEQQTYERGRLLAALAKSMYGTPPMRLTFGLAVQIAGNRENFNAAMLGAQVGAAKAALNDIFEKRM